MAFMLGSFTSGLFGGARSAFDLVNDWNTLKSKRDMRDAAGAVRTAMSTTTPSDTTLPSVTSTSAATPTSADLTRPDVNTMPPPAFMQPAMSTDDVPRPERKPEPPPEKKTPVAQAQQSALPAPRIAAPNYLPPANGAGATYTPMSRPPTMAAQPSALPTMIGGGGLPTITYSGGAPAASVDQGASAPIPPANPTSSLGQQIMRALGNYQPMY